jgi:hypothetical protein
LLHETELVSITGEQVVAKLTIPRWEISQSFDLHAAMICKFDRSTPRKTGAPVISNSKLIEKTWRFALSGSHTQANVLHDDFSKDAKNSQSIWKIHLEDPSDFETWIQAQHSSVLRIVVNQDLQDFVKQESVQALLMTDLVMIALQSVMEDDERLQYIQSGSYPEGTWVQFIKKYYDLVFIAHSFRVKEQWQNEQAEIRARVQHLMRMNLELK